MKRPLTVFVLAVAIGLSACSSDDPLANAESCPDLSDVDVSTLTAAEASQMGDLVFEFAQNALDANDNTDFNQCQMLVQPLDEVGVVLDLAEMDRG